jgi:hypothetical protein
METKQNAAAGRDAQQISLAVGELGENNPETPKYLEWWDAYAKVRIQSYFMEEGRETARERHNVEHFHYTCIYDLLRETSATPNVGSPKIFLGKNRGTSAYQGKPNHDRRIGTGTDAE